MKLETYISELLYRHDCVIVPELGGFLTNYQSAHIHPVSHTMSPPRKSISFNVQLQNNDGLLANYISECEAISFAEAQAKIKHFVKSLQNDLTHKKEATIVKVGVLSRDLNGKITFEPDTSINYLLDSFGLESIQSPAVIRQTKALHLSKQVARGAKSIQKKRTFVNWKVAAVILPLIGLSTYVSFQQEAVKDAYANYAYLNPFKGKPAAVYVPRTISEIHTKSIEVEELLETKVEMPKVELNDKPVKAETIIEANAVKMSYHLIAGCFSSIENANSLVNILQSEGYESSMIGENENGLFRVAFQSFITREDALIQMQKIKNAGKSTWLLKM